MPSRMHSGAIATCILTVAVAACGGDKTSAPLPPSQLEIVVQPSSSIVSGTAIAPGVQVAIQDASGSTVTSATTTISLIITAGSGASGAVLGGTLSRNAVNGVAQFNDVTVDKVGSGYTLTASVSNASLTSATSNAFAVTPGAPAMLSVATQPTSVASLASISPAIQITVLDAHGNVTTNAATSVMLSLTSGSGTAGASLGGTLTQTSASGVSTFANVTIDKVGSGYTLTATASDVASVTSHAFAVTAGTPAMTPSPKRSQSGCESLG